MCDRRGLAPVVAFLDPADHRPRGGFSRSREASNPGGPHVEALRRTPCIGDHSPTKERRM